MKSVLPCLVLCACAAQTQSSLDPAPVRAPEPLELTAAWEPFTSSTYDFMNRHAEVREIMSAGPTTPVASYAPEAFLPLVPGRRKPVGTVWEIDVADVIPFLAQLHPGATPRLRHKGPAVEGGRAVLLSKSAEEFEILLRVHCEFELISGEMHLLPAQFEGHLVWDRLIGEPKSFHLALPPRDTNFDIYYKRSIDIGFIPRMELASTGAEPAGEHADAARAQFRESFYGPQVRWRSLAEALARARISGKPLHVMQLFGTLDDESC